MKNTTIDSINNEIKEIRNSFYNELRTIKGKIESFIPKEFHNNKDLHGYYQYKNAYSDYVGEGNKEIFEKLLEQTLLFEKKYVDELKDTYLKVLEVNGCQGSADSVKELVGTVNETNSPTIWNKVEDLCFPKISLVDRISSLAPKKK